MRRWGGVSRDTLYNGEDYESTKLSLTVIGELTDFTQLAIGVQNTFGTVGVLHVASEPCSGVKVSSGGVSATVTLTQQNGYFDVQVKTTSPEHVFQVVGVR